MQLQFINNLNQKNKMDKNIKKPVKKGGQNQQPSRKNKQENPKIKIKK